VTIFEELKLRIEPADGGEHRVIASSNVGEATGTFALPFSELELENFVLRVSRPRGRRGLSSGAVADAKKFGATLFDSVFQEQVRDLYRTALSEARGANRGLRVTLCLSGSPELMDVPWEYLYDEPNFLAVSAFTPVARYLDLPQGFRPLRVDPPLRILALVSSPSDYDRLDVAREREKLEGALAGLIEAGNVVVEWLDKPSLSSLLNMLQSNTFHVLHFVGHGGFDPQGEQGVLLFEDENGRGRPTSGDELGTILHDFTSLRLAVLNACEGARSSRTDPFSGVAESLVQRGIPAVVAMQFEITDTAAVVFAEGFYRAIAAGSGVDGAVAAARLAIFAASSADIEWGTPVLFMRVAHGQIFEVPEEMGRQVASVEPLAPAAARAVTASFDTAGLSAAAPAAAAASVASEPPTGSPPRARGQGTSSVAPDTAPGRSTEFVPPRTDRAGRRRLPLLAGAAAIVAAAIVGVVVVLGGGSGNPTPPPSNGVASDPAADVVRAASTAITGVRSVHVTGTTGGASPVTFNLYVVNGKGGRGTMSMRGTSFQIIRIGNSVYLKGSDAFLRHLGGEAAAQLFSGKWIKGPATGEFASFAGLTNVQMLFSELLSSHGTLTKGSITTINGQRAIAVQDTSSGGTLYVATTGAPYPLKVSQGGSGSGGAQFSQFNESFPLTVPANAVDLSELH
jgi:hypothetical protein